MPERGALVIYGRGADLGNFKFFADDLRTTELASYGEHIQIVNVERRDAFFELLLKPPLIIQELHIYSHSIGGGLFLGYGDTAFDMARKSIRDERRGGRANYISVLNAEQGSVLTDDLIRAPYAQYRDAIRSKFTPNAKIKIWGCNSGWNGWLYSDKDRSGNYVYDLDAPAESYYWRALNEYNSPKPAVAQAFANYFRVPTYGAGSGSSIQVKYKGRWVSSPDFLKITRRRSVNEADVLRLAPDRGDYNEYQPQ